MNLNDKVGLITAGAGSIGRAIAERFVELGHRSVYAMSMRAPWMRRGGRIPKRLLNAATFQTHRPYRSSASSGPGRL
jgi:NAD(P)-dependent dehydrogenase (short-subunit alcohol dehydrogenase family)